MAKDSTQVLSADADCELYLAAAETTLPSTATAALAVGFSSIGYLQDPPDFSVDRPTKDIEAWNSDDPIRTLIEKSNLEVTLKAQQTNNLSHELYWGLGTWVDDGGTGAVWTPSSGDVIKAMVLEITDGARQVRYAFSRVSVSKVGKLNLARAEAVSYEITLKRLTGTWKILDSEVPAGVVLD